MPEWNADQVGERIRRRREALKLSTQQLALEASLTTRTVFGIEKGQVANPSTATLQAIADVLGLPLSELFDAGSPVTPGAHLPTLTPYLRTKYPRLPPQVVSQLGHYFDYLQTRYGEHRPAEGDDER